MLPIRILKPEWKNKSHNKSRASALLAAVVHRRLAKSSKTARMKTAVLLLVLRSHTAKEMRRRRQKKFGLYLLGRNLGIKL